ncbi:hypothetical protein [Streptomyces sp. NBC_00271]|nr:hypothetical protein [Streptomyces sp. NBC_00271]
MRSRSSQAATPGARVVRVEAYLEGRLGVVAYSECARYPAGTPMTE